MSVTLRLTEVAKIHPDIRQADEHVYPFGGAVHERHLSLRLSSVEIPPHKLKLRPESASSRQRKSSLLLWIFRGGDFWVRGRMMVRVSPRVRGFRGRRGVWPGQGVAGRVRSRVRTASSRG